MQAVACCRAKSHSRAGSCHAAWCFNGTVRSEGLLYLTRLLLLLFALQTSLAGSGASRAPAPAGERLQARGQGSHQHGWL